MKSYIKWLVSQGRMFLTAFAFAAVIWTAFFCYLGEFEFPSVSGFAFTLILCGFTGGMVWQSLKSYNS